MNESGNVRATWDQLYPMGQLFGPSDLGQPFLLKVTKRIGPYNAGGTNSLFCHGVSFIDIK